MSITSQPTIHVRTHPLNPTLTDIPGNIKKIILALSATDPSPHLHIFPELSVWGYPPNDYLFNEELWLQSNEGLLQLNSIIQKSKMTVLLGTALRGWINKQTCYANVALTWHYGPDGRYKILITPKSLLPNYDVFQDKRFFIDQTTIAQLGNQISWDLPSELQQMIVWGPEFTFQGQKIVVTVCEDIWQDAQYKRELGQHNRYSNTFYKQLSSRQLWQSSLENPSSKANPITPILINISASPFERNKINHRIELAKFLSKKYQCHFIYLNQMGANSDLIFDGGAIHTFYGEVKDIGKQFDTQAFDLKILQAESNQLAQKSDLSLTFSTKEYEQESIINAIVLGIRDYFAKSKVFEGLLVSLSGGVDSALVTTLACMALTPEKVNVLLLPSPFSSAGSISDSLELCRRLGITKVETISLTPLLESYCENVNFLDNKGLAFENLQARIRANLVMSLSNKENLMVLACSNKSEIAVGYSTLYGDSCGALTPIGDLYKTEVYSLCNFINQKNNNPIPLEIINKMPSAELKPGQFDQQDLPPYEVLDMLLKLWHEQGLNIETISQKTTLHVNEVRRIVKKINSAEFKRRQSAPILKLSAKTFGIGHQIPPISPLKL